jgi:hypothetical protein
MSATLQLLARYKDFHKLPSDYQAAKRLGIRQNTISKWKAGGTMDDATALSIAQDLQIEPLAVLAQIHMDRPLTPRDRKIWERYCARVLVAALVALAGTVTGPDTTQANMIPHSGTFDTVYIMRTIASVRGRADRAHARSNLPRRKVLQS